MPGPIAIRLQGQALDGKLITGGVQFLTADSGRSMRPWIWIIRNFEEIGNSL